MRTTLDLDDGLMRDAKRRAVESGRTLTSLIETALRELLRREARPASDYSLHFPVVDGELQPGVDLNDRDALFDRLGPSSRGDRG